MNSNQKSKMKFRKNVRRIVFVIIGLSVVCFLPDILFAIRSLVKNIPIVKIIVNENISDKEYVQLMNVALVNLVAVSMSILAYNVSSAIGKYQLLENREKMVMASIYIRDDIKINSGELFDAKQQISNINNVKHNYSQFEEKVIYLFMAEKITQEERELCEEYSNKLESIISYSNRGMDTEASGLVTEYCNSYLIERNGKYVEFKSAMKELLTTLEKIQEE